jgi:hypothetical protein
MIGSAGETSRGGTRSARTNRGEVNRGGTNRGQTISGQTSRREAVSAELSVAKGFLKQFFSGTVRQRSRLARKAPLGAIQVAALHDADPYFRRSCLFFLDHYANDDSMATFSEALLDPVGFVRNSALHGLTCQTCKTEQLCGADVAPGLIEILMHDPSPTMRSKVVQLLIRLPGQEDRTRGAIAEAAIADPDELVRQAATDALAGRFVVARKRYERRQRQHDRFARRGR